MFFFHHGRLWHYFVVFFIFWTKCQAAADSPPNYYPNSTHLSTTISTGTSVIFNTCTAISTLPPFTTTVGNVTVRSTTTTTIIVTLPPDAPARRMVRATSLTPAPTDTDHPSQVTLTTWTTITTCGFTITSVVTLPPVTQKMTVDQLITETQTVFARGPSSSKSTASSTREAIPPVQQVTTTSSTAKAIPPVAEVMTTSSEAPPPAPTIQTTTINGVPFTLSTITSITAIVVNDVTLLPGQALTTDEVGFSNGQTGLEISTAASVGAIVASIFGIATPTDNVVIGGSTLTSGGSVILSGTTYLLPTGGTVPAIVTGAFPTSKHFGVPAAGGVGVVIDGTTLTPGGSVIISGTTYFLPKGATVPVPIADATFVPTAEPSATVSGTGTEAGPSYIQAAGASKGKSPGLFGRLLILCVVMIQINV